MNNPWTDGDDSDWGDLLETIAPAADDLVVLVKSFFDESYNDRLLCVAGYTFTSRNSRLLDHDWRRMLRQYDLPYFRMSACNAGKPPFAHLTETDCVAVATEAIRLIRSYAAVGFAVTVDQEAFYRIITTKGAVSTPYELCAWFSLIAVKRDGDRLLGPHGKNSFVFEAGFKDKGAANRMMTRIFNAPELRETYRYKSHTFMDKDGATPLQAADLLSWQWYKDRVRRENGATKSRGDLLALLESVQHYSLHLSEARIKEIVERINRRAGSPLGNELAGLAMREPTNPIFPQKTGETGNAELFAEFVRKQQRGL